MKKGQRRRVNAKKNKSSAKKQGKQKRHSRISDALAIDLALAFFNVAVKHGLIGPFPKPANETDFAIQPLAGGKAN